VIIFWILNKIYPADSMIKKLVETGITLLVVSFFACIIFMACVFFASPVQIFNRQSGQIETLTPKIKTVLWQLPQLGQTDDTITFDPPLLEINVKQLELMGGFGMPMNRTPYVIYSHITNNTLFVNASVPTAGKPIKIIDGEIIGIPADWYEKDNSNSLEIVDEKYIPVFQEVYANHTLTIRGAVVLGGTIYEIDKDDYGRYQMKQTSYKFFSHNMDITPIFSY